MIRAVVLIAAVGVSQGLPSLPSLPNPFSFLPCLPGGDGGGASPSSGKDCSMKVNMTGYCLDSEEKIYSYCGYNKTAYDCGEIAEMSEMALGWELDTKHDDCYVLYNMSTLEDKNETFCDFMGYMSSSFVNSNKGEGPIVDVGGKEGEKNDAECYICE